MTLVSNNNKDLFKQLDGFYTDPKFPGAFSGIATFYKHLKKLSQFKHVTLKILHDWKQQQNLYTKFKPTKKKFLRRSYKVLRPAVIWEADLLDMHSYAKKNKGISFILNVIDQFTKKLYSYPCKTKSKQNVLNAFKHIFEEQTMVRPKFIYSDNGGEFKNNLVQSYFKELGIKHFTSNDKTVKSAMVERVNRTIKKKLVLYTLHNSGSYINSLQDIVNGYNKTPSTVTKFAPDSIDPMNVNTARINIEKASEKRTAKATNTKGSMWDKNLKAPLLKLGDWVHITSEDKTFRRGFQQQYTDHLFQITDVNTSTHPITYKLKDLKKAPLVGSFQYPELVKVHFPSHFKITNPKLKVFTDNTKTKWLLINIAEYYGDIWIPKSLLDSKRTKEEKRKKEISSSVFLHYLND